ncbi:ATP-binding cassette domain-containing protein [Streptococcus pneumoniae]|nr:ATP-binding cassette domain-containing protein [Streptococcus pneumoniae]
MASLLTLENIHKTFEAGTVNENHVLKGLDLEVEEGDFISVIGGNGAGKSTLMNILAGNLSVDEGDLLLAGKSIKNLSVRKRAKDIARVFQDPKMGTASSLTIEENMAIALRRGQKRGLGWGVKEKDRIQFQEALKEKDRIQFQEALKELNIGLENRLKVDTQYLSGGQRQALTLVMAALVKPKLLLLDEHTAALDPKTSQMVMDLTQKIVEHHQWTTLMITHDMNHAIEYGNRLIMLYQGKIVIDVKGEEKKHLTVEDLMHLFQKNSGQSLVSDELVLG